MENETNVNNYLYSYVVFEIGGIQNFILSTGKMKEMIGGSELIERLSKEILDNFIASFKFNNISFKTRSTAKESNSEQNANSKEVLPPEDDEMLFMQRNAGTFHMLMKSNEAAQEFITQFSEMMIEKYPGLPLFSAIDEMTWDTTSYKEAKNRIKTRINIQRSAAPVSYGLAMNPLFEEAPLDGLPVVDEEISPDGKREFISSVSRTKRNLELIKKSDDRLHRKEELLKSPAPQVQQSVQAVEDNSDNQVNASQPLSKKDKKALKKEKRKEKRQLDKNKNVNKGLSEFIKSAGKIISNLLDKSNDKKDSQAKNELTDDECKELWFKAEWPKDLKEIEGRQGKVAYVHMDGNDYGKLFINAVSKYFTSDNKSKADAEVKAPKFDQGLRQMGNLSKNVFDNSMNAFWNAVLAILPYSIVGKDDEGAPKVTIPLRPLVLGGDDITFVVRADLALIFVDAFESYFEEESKKFNQHEQDFSGLSMGIGIVVCSSSFPFVRAFDLSENLVSNAKSITVNEKNRPGSIDYVVITNDIEDDIDALRQNSYTAEDGTSLLTTKPFIYNKEDFREFIRKAYNVLYKLPRSAIREAANKCRKGPDFADKAYKQLELNIERNQGKGRNGFRLTSEEFHNIFKDGFFYKDKNGKTVTQLLDYLEIAHLCSTEGEELKDYFIKEDKAGGNK